MREFLAAMNRVPADARVLAGSLLATVAALSVIAIPIAIATPHVTPPDPVHVAVKVQSRFMPLLSGDAIPYLEYRAPEVNESAYAPMPENKVETIIYRGDHYKKQQQQKNKKRSSLSDDDTAQASYQLASLAPVTSDTDDIETRPTTLRTPFGVDIVTRVSLSGIPSELTDFLRKVQSQCGKVVAISGFRRSGVPGTCHARHQAVDYQVDDPVCALRVARTFRGGHSTDYHGVQRLSRGMPAHYHVSLCQREMGVRFAHRGGGSRGVRSARHYGKRRHVRMARQSAQSDRPLWSSSQ